MAYKIPSDMIEDRATGVTVASQLADRANSVYVESFKIQIPEADDTGRIQRAINALGVGKNRLEFDSKSYTVSSTITIPTGVELVGTGISNTDGKGTQFKRIADVVAFKCEGISVLSGAPTRYNVFRGIRFHGNASAGYTSDYMQMIACGVAYFYDCEWYSMEGRQLLLHEVMDSRFNNCTFEWGGSTDGTKAAVELKSGSGYEYTNQVYFNDCRFEHYRSKAIETTGTNTNEIFFNNVKMESVQSKTAHIYLNNANMIYFNGLQISSKGTKESLWVTGKPYTSGNKVAANGKIYQAVTTGTSGVTKPSHTSGTVSDGGVDWLYIETLPTINEIIYASTCSGIFGTVLFEHLRTIGDDAAPLDTFMRVVNGKNIDLYTYTYRNGNNITNDSIVRVSADSALDSINVRGVISDDNGTKKICNFGKSGFSAYPTSGQSLAAATYTKLTFPTESFDESNEYDTTNSRFTANRSGIYLVEGAFRVGNIDGNRLILSVYKNGVINKTLFDFTIGGAKDGRANGSVIVKLTKGDYLELYGWSENATTTNAGQTIYNSFAVSRIQ